MKAHIPKGKYVLAVSGGVDSMVLLDILSKQRGLKLVVAHFNHGMRPDSKKDEELVKKTAERYNLTVETDYGELGSDASEDRARKARYEFLNKTKKKHKADAIITAHHQDDLIETAILNSLRGTGRRGLTAIADNPDIRRPRLHLSKKDILDYAKAHRLNWRDDPTNQDEKYLRNYIRQKIMPKLTVKQRQQFLLELNKMASTNKTINQEIANLSQNITKGKKVNRADFIYLPTEVAAELLMHFLHQNGIRDFDKNTIQRLVIAIKTAKAGTKHDIIGGATLEMTSSRALLKTSVGP